MTCFVAQYVVKKLQRRVRCSRTNETEQVLSAVVILNFDIRRFCFVYSNSK